MNGKEKTAQELGRLLARDEGPEGLRGRLVLQREAVVEMAIAGPDRHRKLRRTKRMIRIVAAVSAAAACFVLYRYVAPESAAQIPFFVGDSSIQEREGRFIRTGPNENTVVRFDGGSRFELIESTEARVVRASGKEVTIDLEQGKVHATVVPASKRRWTVRAGPYQVVVKGTVFSVNWDDKTSVLSVRVNRGRVAVLGPGIDREGVPVRAGTSLKADAPAGRITFQHGADERLVAEKDAPTPAVQAPKPAPTQQKNSAKPERKTPSALEICRRLYQEKAYDKMLTLAGQRGFLTHPEQLGRDDLWMFANAVRYARKTDDANALFMAYRSRFPKTNRSRTAAFLLAKAALRSGSNDLAKRWFGTYLVESPNGPLAEEALGHLIDIYADMGNRNQARRLARDYLSKYKGGYFTKQAEQALED